MYACYVYKLEYLSMSFMEYHHYFVLFLTRCDILQNFRNFIIAYTLKTENCKDVKVRKETKTRENEFLLFFFHCTKERKSTNGRQTSI